MFQANPIGYFFSSQSEKYEVPRQPNQIENKGVIILKPQCQFEQALEGLDGFDRIWIIFWFHKNRHWKPKVLPPRGDKKRGVFATRSPHHPNFIGLSCVELERIEGLRLFIKNHDLIDSTPILDIKPYLNYADSFTAQKQGWLEELSLEQKFTICWSEHVLEQLNYLQKEWQIELQEIIRTRLMIDPFPQANNRIKKKSEALYELAYKTWRISYQMDSGLIEVLNIRSGYDEETLEGIKESKWDDVPIHRAFNTKFRN